MKRGIKALLVGESKTGKTACLDTLPYPLVDFSFDIGGWQSLARQPDKKRVLCEGEEEAWITGGGNPLTVIRNLKLWMEKSGRNLLPKERLIVDYAHADPVALGQFTTTSTELLTSFIYDFNQLWETKKCIEKGVCHVALDSLTSFQRPILEYVVAMNARTITVVQDWGQAISKIDEIVSSGVALPFDFIMTAHTQTEKDELHGSVKESLLIYGKNLPSILLAKFDDIFLSVAERTTRGLEYKWGTSRSGPMSVYIPKGMEKDAPPSQSVPYTGVPVGTRNFTNLPPRIEQDFGKLYGEKLFRVT